MKIIAIVIVVLFQFSCATKKANVYAVDFTEIYFNTNGCKGDCPKFSITIDTNKTVVYYKGGYNKPDQKYVSKIDIVEYLKLQDCLSKIDFNKLEDYYKNENIRSDKSTYIVEVSFTNGSVKKVADYASSGPRILRRLYRYFFELAKTHKWN